MANEDQFPLYYYAVKVWEYNKMAVETVGEYEVQARDASHAARQGLDGYTGLLGDPDQSHLNVYVARLDKAE